jgi:hypothetical protein
MSTPITQHVRSLKLSPLPDPGPDFWREFRALVCGEWRRQHLGHCPPSFLGYHGFSSWADAWEDLVTDCYVAAILDPAEELRACLVRAADASVDALVRLHVRWFLMRRRAACDPVGTAVYRRLCRCLHQFLETGEVTAGGLRDPRSFTRAAILRPAAPETDSVLSRGEVEQLVATLPEWRVAVARVGCPRRSASLPRLLTAAVRATLRAGGGFRCRDLIQVVQTAARRRVTAALLARTAVVPGEGPAGDGVALACSRTDGSAESYTWQEELDGRIKRIQRAIAGARRHDAARNLRRVLQAVVPSLRAGEWPSARDVAERLRRSGTRIGKSSVAEHLKTIKELWIREAQEPRGVA